MSLYYSTECGTSEVLNFKKILIFSIYKKVDKLKICKRFLDCYNSKKSLKIREYF